MIHEFKRKRSLFAPIGFFNSVARWCLGIRSSDGSIEIMNTADPGTNGSADLRVNIESVSHRLRARLDEMGVSDVQRNNVRAIIRGTIDGVSVVSIGEHVGVSESWVSQTIEKTVGDSFVKRGDTFVDGKHTIVSGGMLITTDDDPLTDDDIGVSVCAQSDFESLLDDCTELADDVDSILSDYLTSYEIGVSVAAVNHTHDGYAAVNHTHDGYAAVNHTHNYAAVNHTHDGYAVVNHTHNYAAANHTHTKANITNFDTEVTALIPGCFRTSPALYSSAPNNYVMFFIPGQNGNGTVAYADLSDLYSLKNHTHNYAAVNHTHDGYAVVNHTHDGYAAVNHTHGEYALSSTVSDLTTVVQSINDDYVSSSSLTTTLSEYSNTSVISNTYATKSELQDIESDLECVLTTDDIPSDFITAISQGVNSGTFTFVTDIQFDGTKLQKKTRTVTVSKGIVTNIANVTAWTSWHTPTVITWN